MKKASIILLIAFFLVSCGTRKRVMEKLKSEEVRIEVEDTVKEETILKTSNADVSISTEELMFRPIEAEKEMIIEGRAYKNVVIKKKTKKKIDESVVEEKIVKKVEVKKESKKVDIHESKKVDVKRDNSIGSFIWVVILILLAMIIYYILRKNAVF